MELTQRQKALSVMIGCFGDRFTMQNVAAYDRFLQDIPAELVSKAVENLILNSKFPPSIAEIREEARKIYAAAAHIQQKDAGRAWGEVLAAIGSFGSYRKPKFSDEDTAEAVRRYGWQDLCKTPVDRTGVARAQFVKIYEECVRTRQERKRMDTTLEDGKIIALVGKVGEWKMLPGGGE